MFNIGSVGYHQHMLIRNTFTRINFNWFYLKIRNKNSLKIMHNENIGERIGDEIDISSDVTEDSSCWSHWSNDSLKLMYIIDKGRHWNDHINYKNWLTSIASSWSHANNSLLTFKKIRRLLSLSDASLFTI
jgi:hypothetical protein